MEDLDRPLASYSSLALVPLGSSVVVSIKKRLNKLCGVMWCAYLFKISKFNREVGNSSGESLFCKNKRGKKNLLLEQ